jgi:nucleotide-binding universal stress UspA family protein
MGRVPVGRGLELTRRLADASGGRVTALAVTLAFGYIEANEDRERALSDARVPLQVAFDTAVDSQTDMSPGRVALRFVEDAHVAEALDRYAADQLIDLLVVGLHGRQGVLHPKMGHIANHIVASSPCPVLVMPDDQAAAASHLDQPTHHLGETLKGLFHPQRHHASVG